MSETTHMSFNIQGAHRIREGSTTAAQPATRAARTPNQSRARRYTRTGSSEAMAA